MSKLKNSIQNLFFLKATILGVIGLLGASIFAQQSMSPDTIRITSDSSVIRGLSSDDERVVQHRGDVRITRGLIEITGEEATVTISAETGQITNALVKGSPVYFEQSAGEQPVDTIGHSETIEYSVLNGYVIFEGDVSFQQQVTSYKCGKLEYNITTSLAEGTGGCEVTLEN